MNTALLKDPHVPETVVDGATLVEEHIYATADEVLGSPQSRSSSKMEDLVLNQEKRKTSKRGITKSSLKKASEFLGTNLLGGSMTSLNSRKSLEPTTHGGPCLNLSPDWCSKSFYDI